MTTRNLFMIGMLGLLFFLPILTIQKEKKPSKQSLIESIKAEINQTPKDIDVQLVKFVGNFLGDIKIPALGTKLFNDKLTIRNPKITYEVPRNKYVRSGIGFTGSIFLNKIKTLCEVYVLIDTEFRPQFMISVELPAGYKISDLFPSFKALNQLSLPRVKLVFSTIDLLKDALKLIVVKAKVGEFDVAIKQGLTMIASLDLSGPLDSLRQLKEQAKKLDAITIRDEPLYLKGVIPFEIKDTAFTAAIPIRIGIDFTKVRGIPESVTDIFKEFSTDDIGLDLKLPKFKLTLEAGVRIVLGTQHDPIRLSAVISMKKGAVSFGGRMRNQLELEWLSFGDVGFQVDFDSKVMGATGLPFSGLGAYGKIQLGKPGESRASMEASSAIQISKDEFPGLLWHLNATNIRFGDIIELLISIARKKNEYTKPFPEDRIPVMNIQSLKGYVATTNVIIARKSYKQGFALTFDIDMFGQKALFDMTILPKQLQMEGVGYLSNIEVKNKQGKVVFSLIGPGLDQKYDTKDDGPVAFCSFDAKHPGSGAFGVRGMLEIPPLQFKSKIDFVRTKYKLKADIEHKIAGFTTLLQFNIDPLQFKEMFIKIGFKNDFEPFLFKAMKEGLLKTKKKLVGRLDELNKKVGTLSKRIREFEKKGERVSEREIQEAKEEIKKLEKRVASLEKQRTRDIDKGDNRTIRRELRATKIQLGAKKMGLTMLKTGKKIAKGLLATFEKVTQELLDAELLQKAANKTLGSVAGALDALSKGIHILKIKEVTSSYSMPEMLEGKLPKFDFEAQLNIPGLPPKLISLKEMQFDFTKPAQSIEHMVEQILGVVAIED